MSTPEFWTDGDYANESTPPPAAPVLLHYFAHVGFRVDRSVLQACPRGAAEPTNVDLEPDCNESPWATLGRVPNSPIQHALLAPLPWDTTGLHNAVVSYAGSLARTGDLYLAALARAFAMLSMVGKSPTFVTMALNGTLLPALAAYLARFTELVTANTPDDYQSPDPDDPHPETFVEAELWMRTDGTWALEYAVATADLPAPLAGVEVLHRNKLDEVVSMAIQLDLLKRMVEIAKVL
jgi:hypothetical protein